MLLALDGSAIARTSFMGIAGYRLDSRKGMPTGDVYASGCWDVAGLWGKVMVLRMSLRCLG